MVTTFAAPNLPEDEQTLPGSERFFAGGDTTVRGFAFDQLGVRHDPFDETTDTVDSSNYPSGGSGLVVLNGELRVPLGGSFGVVGFLDSGNVFKYARQIDLAQLRSAAGVGVRYKSPIGPIRVDLGFKLGRQPGQNESLTALHISLGQAF
jgi:outer membrane protein insertion porin family